MNYSGKKSVWILCLVLGCLSLSGCNRRPAITLLAEFPHNVRYEQMNDVNWGVRVISYDYPSETGSYIVIPGDVVWCEVVDGLILGEKHPSPTPAQWMDIDRWNQRGFFLLDPTRLQPNAHTDEALLADALQWFSSQEELDDALKAL